MSVLALHVRRISSLSAEPARQTETETDKWIVWLLCVQLRVASTGVVSQVRWLNLHEFHSKKMMKDSNITVQRFRMAETVDDAVEISKTFST